MKMTVKLLVLFVTFLLLTAVASAQSFDYFSCYEITCTNLDNPEDTQTYESGILFDFEANEAYFYNVCGEEGDFSLFFNSAQKQALAYPISGSIFAALKFHGDWLNIITGIAYRDGNSRYEVKGHKPDSCTL